MDLREQLRNEPIKGNSIEQLDKKPYDIFKRFLKLSNDL